MLKLNWLEIKNSVWKKHRTTKIKHVCLQILLHKVFHDILVCNSAREATLSYLAALLRNNEKRAQIQVDERSLAGDGFMLNVLSIMQFLAVKVRASWKCMLFGL
jgi:hypothetical protein